MATKVTPLGSETAHSLYVAAVHAQEAFSIKQFEARLIMMVSRLKFAATLQHQFHVDFLFKELKEWRLLTTDNQFTIIGNKLVIALTDKGFKVEQLPAGKGKVNVRVSFVFGE